MIRMRWRWRPYGSSIHVNVHTAPITAVDQEPKAESFMNCGRLIFAQDEWRDVVALLGPRIDVVEDEGP